MNIVQNASVVPRMSINLPSTEYAKAGAVLKELREKAGLTVPELADVVSEGSYHDILKYEQGYAKIPYGELNDNIRPHQSVIKILEKYKLHKGLINPLKTLKDKDKAKNKETKRNQLLDIKDNLKEYKEIFINKDVGLEFDKWNDYMLSNGKTYKNYSAAFRNWLRNDFDTDSKTIEKNFKKTKTGLFIAYCKKCNKKNYPNDYQLKQSSCCGVDWSPNQTN